MDKKREAMIRRLCERISNLNPHSREIGAGMLATLQAEARAILEAGK